MEGVKRFCISQSFACLNIIVRAFLRGAVAGGPFSVVVRQGAAPYRAGLRWAVLYRAIPGTVACRPQPIKRRATSE